MPSLAIIVAATACGMPIFAAMGGAALLFFWGDGTPANAVPGEAYRLTTSPMLPAIPLFALGGYLLAEGGASRRLTRLFTALFSWMPGGLAIVTTLVLAFFTPLTGASGVTILSMGGVLLPVLVGAGYPQSTSIGLVTVSGSIGLLSFRASRCSSTQPACAGLPPTCSGPTAPARSSRRPRASAASSSHSRPAAPSPPRPRRL